ncbi:phosphoglucosamine mutase [Thermodesulfobacteriota bacterium]
MRRLFGTDGVRGIANQEPMTAETALALGRAAAHIFKNKEGRHKIVIGKDTRLSGYMIENALASGICSMGVDVLLVGPLPTPGIAFITSSMRADAGVVISASHNPFQDNGIKFFSSDGFKLPDSLEQHMEDLIFNKEIDSLRPTAKEVGKAFRVDDAAGRYIVYLKNTFEKKMTLDGIKIAVDCANGAGYKIAPQVFSELGAEVITRGVNPNGVNINARCGALHPDVVSRIVIKNSADVGIALDGDADRVIFIDEKGEVVDGDKIMAICALEMMRKGTLNQNTLVATVMSNLGLDKAINAAGGKVIRANVGDRYVVETMRNMNLNFGGEQSGHLVFLDHSTTGDGILSALQVLSIIIKSGKPLSELAKCMTQFPQVLENIKVTTKPPIEEIVGLKPIIDSVEEKLGENGRLLIRYSGTEHLLRVMIEGKDEGAIVSYKDEIASHIIKQIGETS